MYTLIIRQNNSRAFSVSRLVHKFFFELKRLRLLSRGEILGWNLVLGSFKGFVGDVN
jgi:hypothetical protein